MVGKEEEYCRRVVDVIVRHLSGALDEIAQIARVIAPRVAPARESSNSPTGNTADNDFPGSEWQVNQSGFTSSSSMSGASE